MSSLSGPGVSSATASVQATLVEARETDTELKANQAEASQEKLEKEQETTVNVSIRTTRLERPEKSAKTEKAQKAQESVLVRKEEADALADGFSKRQNNQEYHLDPKALSALALDLEEAVRNESAPDELIRLIQDRMASVNPKTGKREPPLAAHVQKGLEFLLEVAKLKWQEADAGGKPGLQKLIDRLQIAFDKHLETNSKEIQQTEALVGLASQVTETSGADFKQTMKQMHEVVNTPRDVQAIRKQAEAKGGYNQIVFEAKNFYRYVGGALKNNRTENPEIAALITNIRQVRSAVWVLNRSTVHQQRMLTYLSKSGVLEQ